MPSFDPVSVYPVSVVAAGTVVTRALSDAVILEAIGTGTSTAYADNLTRETLGTGTSTAYTDALIREALVSQMTTAITDAVVLEILTNNVYSLSLAESTNAQDSLAYGATTYRESLSEAANASDSYSIASGFASPNLPYDPVPLNMADWYPWCALMARRINGILAGQQNTTSRTLTLNANTTTTNLTDSRIGATSFIHLMPLTANAAAETPYMSVQIQGSATITHSNSPNTDRTYRVLIIA